jgi:phage gp45-like
MAIELNAPAITGNAATSVSFNTPVVHASAAIVAQGDITDSNATVPRTMAGMRLIYNGHTHTDPQGGSVAPPISQM